MKRLSELSCYERKAVRRLIIRLCANYDAENGACLPRDRPCYMLSKNDGEICGYFKNAVLPDEPALEAMLTTVPQLKDERLCAICGKAFLGKGRRYCSGRCVETARRRGNAKRLRRYRIRRRGNALSDEKPAL